MQLAVESRMSKTVGDHLVERLRQWKVRRVFGYPGDGINGVTLALQRAVGEGGPQYVQTRHEELAAFMACAHAKFTGEVGVCLATSGPGAIHLLNGLYDAKLDHQPVVAVVGQQARSTLDGDYQQEVDLASLFKDVASEYLQTVMVPAQLRHVVDRAFRTAIDRRSVTCIILPSDVQDLAALDEPPREHGMLHSGIGHTSGVAMPADAELTHAAELLNSGRRVAILAGAGAMHASDELAEVAERLGAGVAKALLGKACLPDDLPYVTGAIGPLGTQPSWDLMAHCDTLLMVGSNFPYAEFLPPEGQARGVQIDIDGRRLALRYPMEVNLVGDSREVLRALLPRLRVQTDRCWRERIEHNVAHWWQVMQARAMVPAEPINPQRVFWELSPRLPDNCILTCDSGTAAFWFARDLKLRRGMMASLSGGLASMGPALPYAIAAKLAHPTRPVIALLGDAAMQMNGLNALITIAHSWRQWANPRLVVMVLRNDDLSLVGSSLGGPMFVPAFPYTDFAQLLGLVGVCVDAPDGIGTAWDAALAADRPVLLEVVTDPTVPLAPPQATGQRLQAQPAAPPSTPSAPVFASRGQGAGESEAGEEDPGAALDSMSGESST